MKTLKKINKNSKLSVDSSIEQSVTRRIFTLELSKRLRISTDVKLKRSMNALSLH